MTGAEFIILLIFLAGIKLYHIYEDIKFDSYSTKNVSIGKLALDTKSSPRQVRRNMMAGKYDKDEHFKI